jgi:hypothetical protein
MPFSQLGVVGLGQDHNVGSPRGNGNYANLGSNNHGTVLLASNLSMDDGDDNLKTANNHPTMPGAAIQIPGNGQPRQNDIEFWTTPPNNLNQGQDFGDINQQRGRDKTVCARIPEARWFSCRRRAEHGRGVAKP